MIIDITGAHGAISDVVCMCPPVIIIIFKKINKQVHTKKIGIFNKSRDHSTSIKSTETSWTSARYQITV